MQLPRHRRLRERQGCGSPSRHASSLHAAGRHASNHCGHVESRFTRRVDSPMTARSQLCAFCSRRTSISCSPIGSRAGSPRNSWAGSAGSSSRWCATCPSGCGGCSPISTCARRKRRHFRSLHDCFTRELKHGARPIDSRPDILVSPCDAIVGACGTIAGTELYQAKGFPYTLADLLGDRDAGRGASRRPLRDAAADLQHVPPLPCAA